MSRPSALTVLRLITTHRRFVVPEMRSQNRRLPEAKPLPRQPGWWARDDGTIGLGGAFFIKCGHSRMHASSESPRASHFTPDWAALTAVLGILVAAWGGFIVAVTQNWMYGGLILAGFLAFAVGVDWKDC